MAFPLFPKSSAKAKPRLEPTPRPKTDAEPASKPAAKPEAARRGILRPVSARELAAAVKDKDALAAKVERAGQVAEERDGEITVSPESAMQWHPGEPGKIQVAEATPGLCAVLENAALLHANGQTLPARGILEDGIVNDAEAKASPLAWLALLDLMHRLGDRAGFERLALNYVVAFERSAPGWEEYSHRTPPAGNKPVVAGYVALTGKLSATHASQISGLLSVAQKQPSMRLDLGGLLGADDAGATLLAQALGQLRSRRFALALQNPAKIRAALEMAVKQGRDASEGYWLLLLELLQWQNQHTAFEDRAVEYAVAFEVSPPSWEPPPQVQAPVASVPAGSQANGSVPPGSEQLVLQGVLTGSGDPQVARLSDFRDGNAAVPIEMSAVERIDFVAAGALMNSISRIEAQHRVVQIVGASPIVRALLLLIGISPRNFVKKAA